MKTLVCVLAIFLLLFAHAEARAQGVRITLWQQDQKPTLGGKVETPRKDKKPRKTWWQRNRGWVLPVVILGGGLVIVGTVLHSSHAKDCNPRTQICTSPCVPGENCQVRM